MKRLKTEDGSITLFSEKFKEPYHSVTAGAFREALLKFCYPAELKRKVKEREEITLFDFCFGLGYNTVAFIDAVFSFAKNVKIKVVAVEIDVKVIEYSLTLPWGRFEKWKWVLRELLRNKKIEKSFLTLNCFSPNLKVKVFVGEGREFLSYFSSSYQEFADVIFHDPFSPKVCPELWSYEVFSLERKIIKKEGVLTTYSTSSAVRKALLMAGFGVKEGVAVGRKTKSTVASPSFQTEEKLKKKLINAVPYRDLTLKDSRRLIKSRKEGCERILKKSLFLEQIY